MSLATLPSVPHSRPGIGQGAGFGKAQGPDQRPRPHRRTGRAQPDHGADGGLGRLQGGLSQRRLARLVQGRHRGRAVADRDDPGGGGHPHRLQDPGRARRRRRLG